MIKAWNSVVSPRDKVYHLGDVAMPKKRSLDILGELNGDKVLIKGNHDTFKLSDYSKFFRDIRAYHIMNKYILSHVPIHDESVGRFAGNIHGHLHHRRVLRNGKIDPRYNCVSVEHLPNYAPILFEKVLDTIKKETDEYEDSNSIA
jgi:calcineurin-like phosphoesterase family protein